uniref:Uncharacterized protein n=1 Tax=Trypanosoma congolense (strain IL3000) TaxID=1068625 RepID=G0UPL4_TRYCI|nr:conserved hypothetical protein [Trypanosoma congolense IL3000]
MASVLQGDTPPGSERMKGVEEASLQEGSDSCDYGKAMRALLANRVRQRRVAERERAVRVLAHKGVSLPTPEELRVIAEKRSRYEELLRLRKQIDGVERRAGCWHRYLSYESQESLAPLLPSDTVQSTVAGSFEGSVALVSPLLSLFRMMLHEIRVRKRLELLRTYLSLSKTRVLPTDGSCRVVVEVARLAEEGLTVPLRDVSRAESAPEQLLVAPSFGYESLRSPFVFLSRNYSMERLPEFSLSMAKPASNDHDTSPKKGSADSQEVTLPDFCQPPVTLETFDAPRNVYSRTYGGHHVQGHEPFGTAQGFGADESLAAATTNVLGEQRCAGTLSDDAKLFQGLWCSGIPAKLRGPLQEDSLSGSEDDENPPTFGGDISWLPPLPE